MVALVIWLLSVPKEQVKKQEASTTTHEIVTESVEKRPCMDNSYLLWFTDILVLFHDVVVITDATG